MADSEAQELIDLQQIIEALNQKITLETSLNMTSEQEHYIAGLSDALDIVKANIEDSYVIGNTYFVLMPDGKYNTKVVEMRLYKINKKETLLLLFYRTVEEF